MDLITREGWSNETDGLTTSLSVVFLCWTPNMGGDMSISDVAYARAMRIWKKARREGWLDEYLRGNTKGKKASKEAFTAGYVCALVDFETIIREGKNGELLGKDNEQTTARDEKRKVQARTKPNLSGIKHKGEI